jgi:uncharacterized Rmd1/YagE family protein
MLIIDINLVGSVLDSPELMWSEPKLLPTYEATRIYLEINQRVQLLNQKVDVISDLLQMLKQQMTHSHSEYLEWIGTLPVYILAHDSDYSYCGGNFYCVGEYIGGRSKLRLSYYT